MKMIPGGRPKNITFSELSPALKSALQTAIKTKAGVTTSVGVEELDTITIPATGAANADEYILKIAWFHENANATNGSLAGKIFIAAGGSSLTLTFNTATTKSGFVTMRISMNGDASKILMSHNGEEETTGNLRGFAITASAKDFAEEHTISLRGASGHASDNLHYQWSLTKVGGTPA